MAKPDPRTPGLKEAATARLEGGEREFTLDVTGLPRRERDKVRFHINRWLRRNGWRGQNSFHANGRETMTIRVLGRREETAHTCDRKQR